MKGEVVMKRENIRERIQTKEVSKRILDKEKTEENKAGYKIKQKETKTARAYTIADVDTREGRRDN